MAPLQKRALYGLIIGLLITGVFVIVLLLPGDLTAFDRNANIRMVMYAAMIGVPVVFLVLMKLTLRKPTDLDERDEAVISKSRDIQWRGVIMTLAAWTIALTEVYHSQGEVPVPYLTLIFVSTLIMSSLSQAVGILLGYRSVRRHG